MKSARTMRIGLLLAGIALISGILIVYGYRSLQLRAPHDYVLPGDNFDAQTMDTIRAHLTQFDVAYTPQDHQVFMVTGGLGIANPRITEWDSGGNMDFDGHQNGDPMYSFQFTSQSPATWKTVDQPAGDMKPVPWVLKHTVSGTTYHELDMPRYETTQYYFLKGNTYVLLKVDYWPNGPKPRFPEGLLSHLVSVGNPVTGQHK